MDIMNIQDIFLVAIPEISLSIILGLLLINRRIFKQKERIVENLIRFILSIIVVAIVNRYSRIYMSNITLITFCTFIAYSISFLSVWKVNLRKGILIGSIIAYLIVATETATLPIMSLLIEKFQASSLFNIRFILSIPSRIINIVIIGITAIFNIEIKSLIFDNTWEQLDFKKKVSVIGILLMFIFVILISANNSDLYVKLNSLNINTITINRNIQIGFIGVIFFMLVSIILLYIVVKFYEYKNIISKTPEEIFNDISVVSTPEKINDYINILKNHLSEKEVKNK